MSGFQLGYMYPLKDEGSYDDEYGEGYDFALVALDPEEAPIMPQCFIVDCWIVNAKGEKHPGYDCNPVPIHIDTVEIEKGIPLDNPYGRGISFVQSVMDGGSW